MNKSTHDFKGQKILLGITGGIAAYKSLFLVRELIKQGASVRVMMTESAKAFVTPLTIQALTGTPVRDSLFDEQAEMAMSHIELARWADFVVIAPATANTLAKMAQGLADDLLTTVILATRAPVLVCPAMNQAMWAHPSTKTNCQTLQSQGVHFVGPAEGIQACGDEGYGRMSEVDDILDALRMHQVFDCLIGRDVLITAGATREAIDPVRYISNLSSGKMGYALAKAAQLAGANVTLISGPSALANPTGVQVHRVGSATEMLAAVQANLKPGAIFIAAAAVADYSPVSSSNEKIKKKDQDTWSLELKRNPDILAMVSQSQQARFVVGFAAETDQLLKHAKEKLESKGLDMIVANRVGQGLGFEVDDNQVTVIFPEETIEFPLMHKGRLAAELIALLSKKV